MALFYSVPKCIFLLVTLSNSTAILLAAVVFTFVVQIIRITPSEDLTPLVIGRIMQQLVGEVIVVIGIEWSSVLIVIIGVVTVAVSAIRVHMIPV